MDNLELKNYLDEQLRQTKLALDNELANAKEHLNEYLKNKLDAMITEMMNRTEASNNAYVKMYENSLQNIEARRFNGAHESILNSMASMAKKSLASGLENNKLMLLDFINFCKTQLNR
ncbi:MAG: hypothetical protein WCN88_00900 [Candidatus Falkowbacteria bacterium]